MRYTVVLEQEEDGGYVASVPALPGCVSQGDNRAERWPTSARPSSFTSRIARTPATRFPPRPARSLLKLTPRRVSEGSPHVAKLPTDLSGRDVRAALERAGFIFRRQTGSHMILRRDEPYCQGRRPRPCRSSRPRGRIDRGRCIGLRHPCWPACLPTAGCSSARRGGRAMCARGALWVIFTCATPKYLNATGIKFPWLVALQRAGSPVEQDNGKNRNTTKSASKRNSPMLVGHL